MENKNTVYLLTGATGYLGSHISRSLIADGKTVRALVLKSDPNLTQIPKEAEIITGDIIDTASLEEFFKIPDSTEIIVIHCAEMFTASPYSSDELYDVNVKGTKKILEACINQKVKKMVYVSSTSAIPELEHGKVISERYYFHPHSVVGGYGKTKAAATRLALHAAWEYDLDVSIVFPSSICGPNNNGTCNYSKFIIDYFHGKIPVGINGSLNAVDVRDIAEGVISCTEKGKKGECYIMSNSVVSGHELLRLISKYTGAPEPKHILSITTAKILNAVSAFISLFTKKPRRLTSYSIYVMGRNNVFSCKKAQRELDFKARPLEETMKDMAIWLHNKHLIHITGEPARKLNLKQLAA
jgi:dihydroflavonol-4-reductase